MWRNVEGDGVMVLGLPKGHDAYAVDTVAWRF